jgi:hypothetical protein
MPLSSGVPGCCACAPPCAPASIQATYNGCNGRPVQGLAVELRLFGQPTALLTGTTDAAGQVTFSDLSAVPYQLLSFGTGWQNSSVSVNPACGQSLTPTITLSPSGGYICIPCSPWPVKSTLHYSTGLGSGTVNYAGGWLVSATVTAPGRTCFGVDQTVTGRVDVQLRCNNSGNWEVVVTWTTCGSGCHFFDTAGGGTFTVRANVSGIGGGAPVNVSVSFPSDFSGITACVKPPVGSITFTE